MTKNIYWLLQLNINDGKVDDFKALAAEMTESTKAESGAIAYEWHMSEDGKLCHIYERYADNAATMVHLGNFGEKFAERFMACVAPVAFWVYGPADAKVREAVAGLGAAHFTQFAGFIK